jgi:hypothetical protein
MATKIVWLPLNLGKSFLAGDYIHLFVAIKGNQKVIKRSLKVIEIVLGCASMYFEMNGSTTHIFSIINFFPPMSKLYLF